MERICHELIQGTDAWAAFRLEHHGASEAAAMLGLSKNTTRNALLHVKHTGLPKEFSDFVQEHILDHGHEVEALARPLVEAVIGDELYPATYSFGKLSASCDGLTMDGETAFEHKQFAKELAASVARGELPIEHEPQCQQVMLCTGAKRVIFVVSDGTPEHFVHMEVFPDEEKFKQLVEGWAQFDADLATYKPPEYIPAAVAKPIMALPAVSIKVDGKIALVSNLDLFGEKLKEFVARIPQKPETDQQFADCKASIAALKTAEDALDAAEAQALGQVASFDEMKRAKELLFKLARDTRLAVEKMVTAEEKRVKENIVVKARDAFAAHIATLNLMIGKPYMPTVATEFVAAIKGKRTIASLQNAVDTELARAKIVANDIAAKIKMNRDTLIELATNHAFLFSDVAQIVLKAPEDFTTLVKLRIKEHDDAKAAEVEEIRKKAEADARAKVEAENKARQDEIDRKAREEERARQDELTRKEQATRTVSAPAALSAAPPPVQTVIAPLASVAATSANHIPGPLVQGTQKLRQLIDAQLGDMSAGELQQALDAIRNIVQARAAGQRSAA